MPKTVENPDDSHALLPTDDRLTRITPPDTDAAPEYNINALFAAQIAVHDLLTGLEVSISDYDALINRQQVGVTKTFKLARITCDHPKSEDEIQPLCAAIVEESAAVYDEDAEPPRLVVVEFDELHSLQRISHLSCSLMVEAWFGHKEERRAFRTAFQRILLADPLTPRSDRIVVVPQYFGRPVRLRLTKVFFPESAAAAQANHWTVQFSIRADLEELRLVPRKAGVRVETRVHAKP
jgi:hypothetical protein